MEWSFCGLRVPTPNPARFRQFRASYTETQHNFQSILEGLIRAMPQLTERNQLM